MHSDDENGPAHDSNDWHWTTMLTTTLTVTADDCSDNAAVANSNDHRSIILKYKKELTWLETISPKYDTADDYGRGQHWADAVVLMNDNTDDDNDDWQR